MFLYQQDVLAELPDTKKTKNNLGLYTRIQQV